MNIAYFCDALANHEAKWINEFAKKHTVIIFSQMNVKIEQTAFSNAVVCLYDLLPGIYPVYNFLQKQQLKRKIGQLLKLHNIDIVHSMYAYPYAMYADWTELPKIITTRGSDVLIDYNNTFKNPQQITEAISYYFYKKWFESAFHRAERITSTSYRQQEVIHQIIPNKSKAVVVRTGINTAHFRPDIIRNEPKKEIIFSPRLMKPLYNIDQVLLAFAEVLKTFPSYKLIQIDNAIGSDYSNQMHQLAKELNIEDKIIWKPFVGTDELIQLYAISKIVVMIPDSDGTPNSALEAMLLQTPVIMGNVPYDKDIFNENTIWQIQQNSSKQLALTIEKILEMPEKEITIKLENASNTVQKKATLSTAINTIETLYDSIATNFSTLI